MEQAVQMLRYHIWATEKVLAHLNSLPESTFLAERNDVFPSIKATLEHLYDVDETWFKRSNGEQVSEFPEVQFASIEEAQHAFRSLHKKLEQFYQEREDCMINYENSKGDIFENKLSDIVFHIVNHGTYHRGNLASMVRQLGFEGVAQDYIYYVG